MDKINIESIYPLSPIQQGILFHSTLQQAADVYFGQIMLTLQGRLDLSAFTRSWEKIVERHSILRTIFTTERQGKPVQVVLKVVPVSIQQLDWRELPETEQQEQMVRFLRADREAGLNLAQAPLMRLALIRLGEDLHKLIWSEHHLLLDGWSVALILNEFKVLYASYLRNQEAVLPAVRPYRDHISWLGKQDAQRSESYWRQLLKGFHAPTVLGIEKAKTHEDAQSNETGELRIEISADTVKKLQLIGRDQRLTLNTIVQGAWAVLLSRYSGQQDVVYGTTVSGRQSDQQGTELMVGPFINTLPVRVQFRPGEKVGELLERIQAQQVETREFEYTPLVDVQSWSEIERGVPLFNSIFVFENYPSANSSLPENELLITGISAQERSNFPIALVAGLNTTLTLKLLYSREHFEEASIGRLLQHLSNLLVGIADGFAPKTEDLMLTSSTEREQILKEWNRTSTDYPREKNIGELFAEQALLRPHATAVQCGQQKMTYSELESRSNQLARYLQNRGAGLEQVVAICLDRSPQMIIGLLAILKAGAAYLPIDSSHPGVRLQYMLEDSNVHIVLTQGKYREKFSGLNRDVIALDEEWTQIASCSGEVVETGAEGANLAYVMYTSGTTGKPKGIGIEHRSISRLVKNTNYLAFSPNETFLQFAPVSFDASTLEIWGSLLNGARLVVFPPHMPSLDELAEEIEREKITTLWLTAGLFHQMAEAHPECFKGLRQLVAGGDVLFLPVIKKIISEFPGLRLVNGYGPTENTTFTCCHTITDSTLGSSVPIGVPIANTQTYILDSSLQLLPQGVAGELCIGGDGLARSYGNSPELTAERFIPNPFFQKGERLFRSGDRARYLSDGSIEFLGRIDNQVKIRGFRIELEEIEAALTEYSAVHETAVVVSRSANGEPQLVAFVVPSAGSRVETDHLRAFLKERLPAYMVPSFFIVKEMLPLTANGKINRKALALEMSAEASTQITSQEPRTPVEEVLAGLWQELLKVASAGIEDDFFELGGHSLLAMQLISRIKDLFEVAVPLRSFFACPTIAALAAEINGLIKARSNTGISAIQPAARGKDLPLSLAQQRLWFLNKLEPHSAAYNIPIAFQLRGEVNREVLERSLNELVARHESLRTTFPDVDGEAVQFIAAKDQLKLEWIDLHSSPEPDCESQARKIVNDQVHRPFDLASGPLIRCILVRKKDAEHILLIVMHHIISDGHSVGLLCEELSATYNAFSAASTNAAQRLPLQYADYAIWEREWLLSETADRLLEYWKGQLAGAPLETRFKAARPRPAKRSSGGATYSWMLPLALTEKLETLGRQEGATKFMVLLAAFYIFLHHQTGNRDLVVGADVANRNENELQSVTGFFVNQLALRMQLAGYLSFRELLHQVRRTALAAYVHHELPFQKILDGLKIERRLNYTPIFQVKLLFQDGQPATLRLDGIDVEPFQPDLRTSAFDLVLAILRTQEGFLATFEYDTDLFERGVIAQYAADFEAVLARVAFRPELRLAEIETALADLLQQRQFEEARTRNAVTLSRLKQVKAKAVLVEN